MLLHAQLVVVKSWLSVQPRPVTKQDTHETLHNLFCIKIPKVAQKVKATPGMLQNSMERTGQTVARDAAKERCHVVLMERDVSLICDRGSVRGCVYKVRFGMG